MKKDYEKPELDIVSFEVETAFASVSDPGGFSPLEWVNDKFENMTDGIMDFLSGLNDG